MAGLVQALETISSGNGDIYALELDGIDIVFVLPSIKQAQQYQKLLELAQDQSTTSIIYEHIFKNAVVDEFLAHRAGDIPAGIPETIAKLIFMLSGIGEEYIEYTKELMTVYRQQTSQITAFMKRVICSAFGGYTFELLDTLNYQNLVQIFIQAEKLQLEHDIIEDEYKFVDPQPVDKHKPFKVEDIIKHDAEEHQKFDSPVGDPKSMAKMAKMREEAIRRAREQELKHRRGIRR